MTNRKPILSVILMVAALMAVLAAMVAPGCGPAAPPAQDIPPVAEEPTVAPTPEATPVYYPEVIAQRDPALHPILNAFVLKNADSAGGGASCRGGVDQTIPMAIGLAEWEDIDAVRDFLDDNGIAIKYTSTHSMPEGTTSFRYNGKAMDPPYTWSDGTTLFLIDVPAHLIPGLSKLVRPKGIGYTGELPYPRLSPELNELVIAHQAGLLPSEEWPTAVVSTLLLNVRTFNELTRYLNNKKDEGAIIIADPEFYEYMTFGAVVPLDLIAPMSEIWGVERVDLFRYPTPPKYVEQVLGVGDGDDAQDDAQSAPMPAN